MPRKKKEIAAQDYALQKPDPRPLTDTLKSVAERSGIAEQAPPRSLPDPTGQDEPPEADMGWQSRIRPYHHTRGGVLKGEAEAIFLRAPDSVSEAQAESLGNAGFRLTEDNQYWVAPASAARRLIADKVARELAGESVDYYAGIR